MGAAADLCEMGRHVEESSGINERGGGCDFAQQKALHIQLQQVHAILGSKRDVSKTGPATCQTTRRKQAFYSLHSADTLGASESSD